MAGPFDCTSGLRRQATIQATGGTATLTALLPTYTAEADLADQDEYEVRIYETSF
jgi:hypothetical protein